MSDLIKRLRRNGRPGPLECEAADALEEAQEENERLKKELTFNGAQFLSSVKRIDQLEAALKAIVTATPANEHKKWPHHHYYLFTARTALEITGDSRS